MILDGKIALVTGGTGELGRAVTRKFLSEGADVSVTYRNAAEMEAFQKEFPRVGLFRGDVSNQEDVASVFSSLLLKKGRVDILCNLVGGYMPKKEIPELTEQEWDFMFSLNLKTCFLCTKHALKIMRERKYGRIVNVSALAGLEAGAGRGAYGISKSAVATFTRIAGDEAKSYAGANVVVNAIAPSILLTRSNKSSASPEETSAWVTLEEAASLVLFLASNEASGVNGETIRISGRV